MKPNNIKSKIMDKLNTAFNPSFIDLINESHMHNVPENSETHFKLIIVSDLFIDLSLVQRHKKVFESLGVTMDKIHALSMSTYDLNEYESNPKIIDSPECANK